MARSPAIVEPFMNRLFAMFVLAFAGSILMGNAAEPDNIALPPEDLAFFETHIRPALIEHCYECHSKDVKVKGGLLLDRRAGWQHGGDSGPAIIPRDAGRSLLVEAIRYQNPDLEMPPDGKLPDDIVARFETWINRGAADPRDEPGNAVAAAGIDLEQGRQFWSFQPRKNPQVPDQPSAGSVIDRFLLEKLSEAKIEPNGKTDPGRLLRRAKVDLTGLPPTLEEQEEFYQNSTDKNFAGMVDRWLASRAFGERWGRHWLDLARYADTSGGGRAMPLPDAWRFRDLVIDSFTRDVPLDELIRLHIAGDLLPFENDLKLRERNLTATGFLVLGPHNYENQNKNLLDLEIADEQIDTIGRAFLGMTIGCARCHDHKFDPIPTADYYALTGIFLSTNSVTHSNVSRWHTEPIPATQEQRRARDEHTESKEAAERKIAELKKKLAAMGRFPDGSSRSVAPAALSGIVIDDIEAEKVGEWMESTSNPRYVGAGYIHDQRLEKGQKSVIYRHRFQKAGEYELRVGYSSGSNRNPRTPVVVEFPDDRIFRFELNQITVPEHDRLFDSIDRFTIGEREEVSVVISNDSAADGVVIADCVQWIPVDGDGVEAAAPKEKVRDAEADRLEEELKIQTGQLKKINKSAPKIPSVMCVVDREKEKIGDTEIRIRGVENNYGPPVNRGFLQVASWEKDAEISREQSGRLELANWITDSQNPLTARVLANRIWWHLMGRGLVNSPDNFGTTGEAPAHPELLDYLANRLVESGWSTKNLIREIVLSDAYSRSSETGHSEAGRIDPENRLYWRAHHRFLDAESLRDSVLTIAGSLDQKSGGPALPEGFKSEFGYEFQTKRRSVYVPVFRNAGHELLGLFDFANPNFAVGKRSSSTIPTQALYLTNSPFIHDQAQVAAGRILKSTGKNGEQFNDRQRIALAYQHVLGRSPNHEELDLSLDFLRSEGDTGEANYPEAWASLFRSLFACVDFRVLR